MGNDVLAGDEVGYAILAALIDAGPKGLHGYAILDQILGRGAPHRTPPSLARLYQSLFWLHDHQMVEASGEYYVKGRLRKHYRITGLGSRNMTNYTRACAQGRLSDLSWVYKS